MREHPRVAARANLLVPGVVRWPLDPARPVIELTDISVAFGGHPVLDGLNLSIRAGQTTVIMKLTGLRHRMPGDLSMADRKRVGIARALVMKPDIVIYDEPTTGQDPVRSREIDDMIQETQSQFAITSIVISHDMESSFRIADRIAVIHDGAIATYGTPQEVLGSPDEYVQRFLHAAAQL